jgi:UDP-N-acetylmuramoyl-tripeptide--D-alanyl-D-alanine ligase
MEATGGSLVKGTAETRVSTFALDTRRMKPGGAFFALKGNRADGHTYLAQAARAGAALAVIHENCDSEDKAPETLIRVDDTTEALGRCGAYVRNRLKGIKLIAVTGSTGKTTTKELIAAGLVSHWKVHRSPGNFNNHLGVPLSLLACPEDTEVIVQEMGMSAPGEIAHLTKMANPDVGLVTNVCPAHLGAFQDLDEIASAKGEMFAFLSREGTSVVNVDDPRIRVQSMRHDGPRVTYGRFGTPDLRLEYVENRFLPGARFEFRQGERRYRLKLKLGGAHSAQNALAAMAAIHAVGGELEPARKTMEQVEPGPGRGRILRLKGDILLIDDSYNSNPTALGSVLETLKNTSIHGRKILVMGDMLELGPQGKTFHYEAGRKAASAGVAMLVGVGPLTRSALESGRRSGIPEIHHESETNRVVDYLSGRLRSGDLVIVKGSRGVGLDRVVDALVRERGRTD